MIVETDHRECDVCELIERGIRTAGGIYFAGLLAGLYLSERRTPLCPVHFETWKKIQELASNDPIASVENVQ